MATRVFAVVPAVAGVVGPVETRAWGTLAGEVVRDGGGRGPAGS